MWKIVRTLLSLLIVSGVYFLCEKATWGFTLTRLHTQHDIGFENEGLEPTPYLQQKYYLKAQGGQSYVFFSEDGQYVLKFFKDMPRPWLTKESYQTKKWGKLHRTLTGYKLAYDHLLEETGLITLHLKPYTTPLITRLIDRLGIEHTVDLGSTYFVIQKRAEPLTFDQFQSHIQAIRVILKKQQAKQIVDHDTRLLSNIGWADGQPLFIDPGRFTHE